MASSKQHDGLEQGLVLGGALTSTGLYAGNVARLTLFRLASAFLRAVAPSPAPVVPSWNAFVPFHGEDRTLIAYDNLFAGVMLRTKLGIFYLTAPDYRVYRFCMIKPKASPQPTPNVVQELDFALPAHAFFLYHSTGGCATQMMQERVSRFGYDSLLQMLLNDLALMKSHGRIDTRGTFHQALCTLLSALCRDTTTAAAAASEASGRMEGWGWRRRTPLRRRAEPDSRAMLSEFVATITPAVLRTMLSELAAVPDQSDSLFFVRSDNQYDEHRRVSIAQGLGMELAVDSPFHLFVVPDNEIMKAAADKIITKEDGAERPFLGHSTKRIGRLRYGIISVSA